MALDWIFRLSERFTKKIDDYVTQGLAGVENSLAYRVHEIERHLHSFGDVMELAGTPSGETHIAVEAGDSDGVGVWQLDGGDSSVTPTWGSWVQILGSSDTPVRGSNTKFDLHKILVTATEKNFLYYIQFGFDDSGADALSNGNYTTLAFSPSSNLVDAAPVEIQTRRIDAGTKVWARCMCVGQDTGTIDFVVGLHEYEG